MNDIPAKTSLARAPQHSPRSTPVPTSHSELAPASAKTGIAELTACLTLVASSGMSAEDRTAWISVARETLRGMPGDLLQRGCRKARETCRFASEIVPTIMETAGEEWELRRRRAFRQPDVPRLPQPDCVDPAEIRKLIRSL